VRSKSCGTKSAATARSRSRRPSIPIWLLPGCQSVYEEFEGVAYHLSSLPEPEASCDLSARVIRHIATLRFGAARTPIVLTSVATPIGPLYVGFKEQRIAYIGIDTGETHDEVRERVETRLRRPVEAGPPPSGSSRPWPAFFRRGGSTIAPSTSAT